MANSIILNGTIRYDYGTTATGTISTNTISPSGSNYISNNINLTSAGWTGLSTSSLSDTRYIFLDNLDTTSSISVATDASGTNVISRLYPGDVSVISYSGSLLPLYAKVTSGSTATLAYIIGES